MSFIKKVRYSIDVKKLFIIYMTFFLIIIIKYYILILYKLQLIQIKLSIEFILKKMFPALSKGLKGWKSFLNRSIIYFNSRCYMILIYKIIFLCRKILL